MKTHERERAISLLDKAKKRYEIVKFGNIGLLRMIRGEWQVYHVFRRLCDVEDSLECEAAERADAKFDLSAGEIERRNLEPETAIHAYI